MMQRSYILARHSLTDAGFKLCGLPASNKHTPHTHTDTMYEIGLVAIYIYIYFNNRIKDYCFEFESSQIKRQKR